MPTVCRPCARQFVGLLIVASLALLNCAPSSSQTGKPQAPSTTAEPATSSMEPIKIGETMPLTGTFAEHGGFTHTAILMAAEDANQQGGINGRKLEIAVEDTQGDPKAATAAALKLITVDRVPAIMTTFTAQTLAQIPVADQHRVVIFANSGVPTTAAKSEWAFNTFVSLPYQTQVVAEFAVNQLGHRRFTAIICNQDNCLASNERFEETLKALGAQIVASENYDANATDFRSQLTKLQASRPDALMLFGTGGKADGLILKQMAEMGFKTQVLGFGPSVEAPETMSIAGPAAEGLIYGGSDLDLSNPDTESFVRRFERRVGQAPDFGTVTFYDTTRLLGSVLARHGTDPSAIRQGLIESGPQSGAAGTFQITKDRTADWQVRIKTVKNGQFVLYGQ